MSINFGGWLLGQRVARGMTIRQAHKAAGLSWSGWSELEKGGRRGVGGVWEPARPTSTTLVKVARVLDLPPSEVFAAAGVNAPDGVDTLYDQERQRLLDSLLSTATSDQRFRDELRKALGVSPSV